MATAHRLSPPFGLPLRAPAAPAVAAEPRDPTKRYYVAPGLRVKRRWFALSLLGAVTLAALAHLGLSYGPEAFHSPSPRPGAVAPPGPVADPLGTPVRWNSLPRPPERRHFRAPAESSAPVFRSPHADFGAFPSEDAAPSTDRSN